MKKNDNNQQIKLVISGGHLTPALAFVDYVSEEYPQAKIEVIGRLYSQANRGQRSREQEEIKQRQIPFHHLSAPKFANQIWWQQILSLPALLLSIIRSYYLLSTIRPQVFLSFGGYLAVPIAVAAWLKKIPIVTHEQTNQLGLANQQIAKIATAIALSYESDAETQSYKNAVLTGNPLRSELFIAQPKPDWLPQIDAPILYVTGGRLGSEIINTTISHCLPQLLKKYVIIHQTGPNTTKRNYKREMEQISSQLSPKMQKRYFVREWVSGQELGWILQSADLVISRAGANTTAELAALKVPCILIPLPFAFNQEQHKNAQILVELGIGQILDQKQLAKDSLLTLVNQTKAKKISKRNLEKLPINVAAEKIWQLVQAVAISTQQ